MDHIAVNPAALTGASGVQGALAADLLAVSGLIQAAGAQAAGACGEPSASAAVGAGSADLGNALAQLAASVSGVAENLGTAAYVYEVTDATQMGG
jgi:hypothetical protein